MKLPRFFGTSRTLILATIPLILLSLCAVDAWGEPAKKKNVARDGVFNLSTVGSVEFEGESLVPFLEKSSKAYNFEFVLDRRIDPNRTISGSYSDLPFRVVLWRILEDVDLYCFEISDSTFYIGSRETIGEILLGVKLKRKERTSWSKKFAERINSTIDLTIPPAAETSELFEAIEKKTRVKLIGAEYVPFDRVRGVDLKDVLIGDLLTIFLFGYNLDFQYELKTSETKLVALDREREVVCDYSQAFDVAALQKDFPELAFETTDEGGVGSARVKGAFKDVARLEFEIWRLDEKKKDAQVARASSSDSNGTTSSRKISGSSRVEISGVIKNKRLVDVFAFLQKNAQIECVLDDSLNDVGVSLDSRVSCEFKQADVGAVASILARKLGVDYKIENETIRFLKK